MATTAASPVKEREAVKEWHLAEWGVFFLRITLGTIFFMHGSQKVLGWFGGHGLAESAAMMGKMGIPAPLAYLSIFTEFLGGILLIVGALTRVVGIALIINMAVAIAVVHFKNGFFLNGANGPGYEYNVALIGMALALVLTGPGAIGLADWEQKVLKRS